jgi:hypothetical protein
VRREPQRAGLIALESIVPESIVNDRRSRLAPKYAVS